MALSDEVTSRYASKLLINLSNPQDTSATTINTTRLGLAATDVEADFEIYAGVEYDGTEARHVTVAAEGVVHKLRARTGHADAQSDLDAWRKRLIDLGRVTGRDRISPATTSKLEPSEEKTGDEVVRPLFDDDRFDGFIPGAPPQ